MTCQICSNSGQLGRDGDGEIVFCTCVAGLRANVEHCDTLIAASVRALREAPDDTIRLACDVVQDERDYCMDRLIEQLGAFCGGLALAETVVP